jgi:hypothetical protein
MSSSKQLSQHPSELRYPPELKERAIYWRLSRHQCPAPRYQMTSRRRGRAPGASQRLAFLTHRVNPRPAVTLGCQESHHRRHPPPQARRWKSKPPSLLKTQGDSPQRCLWASTSIPPTTLMAPSSRFSTPWVLAGLGLALADLRLRSMPSDPNRRSSTTEQGPASRLLGQGRVVWRRSARRGQPAS